MHTSEPPTVLGLIRSAGLAVDGVHGNTPGPSVETAWRAMAGFTVEPSATFPLAADRRGVHDLWLAHARRSGVIAGDGTFLVTAVALRSADTGWIRARLTDTADVARLVDDQQRIEFIARSASGDRICGITAEEYDYWLITLPLPPAQ
ncbi:hypothetical protein SUDANB120_06343 (plasmid) [Streptomyces sp. enrichment culture]|uniref:hypothetical protein n=1 Tax=Streptomyces TaxID=1883 RepID=UPI00167320AB|nr:MULTISPECIES: hypothetical protein [Streptomyces]MBD3575535.1 hypothetical protein [Streptomyces sp. KD18]GGT22197.1 hypothetical protein GCM10010286_54620 [Streptomyces toxytricini]